jgi:hypothetical protein
MTARPPIVLFTHDADLGSALSAILAPIADLRIATQVEAWNARRAIAFPCVTIVDTRALDRETRNPIWSWSCPMIRASARPRRVPVRSPSWN